MGTKAVPDFLQERGQRVVTKAQQFGMKATVKDVQWLEWCGAEWVAITKDEAAVRKVRAEMAAARRYKVRVFYFPNASLRKAQYLEYLDRHWAKILALCATPGPFVYGIYSDKLEQKS